MVLTLEGSGVGALRSKVGSCHGRATGGGFLGFRVFGFWGNWG